MLLWLLSPLWLRFCYEIVPSAGCGCSASLAALLLTNMIPPCSAVGLQLARAVISHLSSSRTSSSKPSLGSFLNCEQCQLHELYQAGQCAVHLPARLLPFMALHVGKQTPPAAAAVTAAAAITAAAAVYGTCRSPPPPPPPPPFPPGYVNPSPPPPSPSPPPPQPAPGSGESMQAVLVHTECITPLVECKGTHTDCSTVHAA